MEAIESKIPVSASSPVASKPGWSRTRCCVVRVPASGAAPLPEAGEGSDPAGDTHRAKLRHLAIACDDPDAMADFYVKAFGFEIVPQVAGTAGHLDVYQRTAPYVIPRNDRRYTRLERLLFRHVPAVQKVYRTATYWARESYVPAFTRRPRLADPVHPRARGLARHGRLDRHRHRQPDGAAAHRRPRATRTDC